MDNQRIVLFFALSFVLLLLWQAWQEDYGVPSQPQLTQPSAVQDIPSIGGATSPAEISADMPSMQGMSGEAVVDKPFIDRPAPGAGAALQKGQRIHIVTDVLDVQIDTIGGDIRQADLLTYPVSVTQKSQPFRLLRDEEHKVLVAQSGLLSDAGAPDHHARFSAAQTEYTLAKGADSLVVPLTWQNEQGIKVTKTFTFHRNSYLIDVEQQVENGSTSNWSGYQYRQLQRTRPGDDESAAFIYTYTGGVIYSEEEKYEKIDFDDMDDENLSRDIKNGWAAMIQHYFVTAWLPESDEQNHFYSKAPPGKPYVLGMVSPQRQVAAGDSTRFTSRLYIGPKEQKRLEQTAPGMKLTVDYGILTILAQPIFWLLSYIHGVIANWGWSIIVLTLIIKLIFYKLSEISYRSMANMRTLHPKITSLRERYGDDRQRMSQAMMELYKKEKINPLGGCLPMIVQIPVFIALYWVLLESVELRQAPFILWIHDLSIKDPYYVLPLLMGVTMFMQQKLNPPPPDPVQAKVLMALPFIFTIFFAFFPAGLVLYWVSNSVISIAQQWVITRRIEKAHAKRKA